MGEATTAQEGLELISSLRPDVAIVDLRLPGMDGIELTREILIKSENTRVMILSGHADIDLVRAAARAGASGYVIKESGGDCVLKCLEFILAGKRFIDRSLSEELYGLFLSEDPADPDGAGRKKQGKLTARELKVMSLLLEGMNLKAIAAELNLAYNTVAVHRSSMMKKLRLSNDMDLVRYAISNGLIDPEIWRKGG